MSGDRIKIDLLPAGAVVGAFQVQDAVHDGVIDAAHTVPVYWYGKHKAASLFGTGPVFGGTRHDDARLVLPGRRQGVLPRADAGHPRPQRRRLLSASPCRRSRSAGSRTRSPTRRQLQGLKYRTVGLAADLFQAMGVSVAQLPGGEIVPAMERGVIDAFEFNNPTSDMRFGAQDVAKNYMLGSYHQARESFEFMFNKDVFDGLDPDLQAILEVRRRGRASSPTPALAMRQVLGRPAEAADRARRQRASARRTSILQAQLEAWDKLIADARGRTRSSRRCIDSQRAWVERVVYYSCMNAPDYQLAYEHYFPGKI